VDKNTTINDFKSFSSIVFDNGNSSAPVSKSSIFENFFYTSPIASALIDFQGCVINQNKAFCDLFLLNSEEEIRSFNFLATCLRNTLNAQIILQTIQVKSNSSFDNIWRIGNKTLYLKETFTRASAGDQDLYYVVIENNTDFFRTQRTLQITEEKYKNIIDQVPVGIYRTIASSEIIFGNKYLAGLFGFNHIGELIGQKSLNYFHNPIECRNFFKKQIRNHQTTYIQEYQICRNDNSLIWVKDSGRIFYDTNNDVLFFDGILEEITVQKNAEQELNRLVAAINQISEAILITDTQGLIQFANPMFEKMTLFSCKDVIGKSLSLILKSDQSSELFFKIHKSMLAGQVWSGTTVSKRKDESVYHEHLVVSPLKNSKNEIVNFIVVKRDITQELKLEEQLRQSQKLQAIGTLAGGIAHDFNNILMGMQIYTEILLKKITENTNEHDILKKIFTAETRAKDLIKQILSFSRITGNELEKLHLHIILKEDLKYIKSTFPTTIRVDVKVNDCGYIMGNPAQIHQILMNICNNANHAMEGKGVLSVSLNRYDHVEHADGTLEYTGNDWICLKISDTGCGIESKIAERIFEPFFTTKSVGKGTGLGLASVHGIVKQYKGEIYFNTEIGQGTTFYIYLPAL
jgi:PAS domain S-box-containing protein